MKKQLVGKLIAGLMVFAVVFTSAPLTKTAEAKFWGVNLYDCYAFARYTGHVFSAAHPEKNACTAAIQQWLNEDLWIRAANNADVSGWPSLVVDGRFGTQTGYAVNAYLRLHGFGAGAAANADNVLAMHYHCRNQPWGLRSATCFD